MKTEKLDDFTLKVEKEPVILPPVIVNIELEFLKKQEKDITEQRDEMIRLKEAELKEVQDLIKACEDLGVKERSKDVEVVEEIEAEVVNETRGNVRR